MRRLKPVHKFFVELYEGMTHDNGRFSHTRCWSSIAYAVASFVVVKLTILGGMNPEYLLIYLATAGAHHSISKYITLTKTETIAEPTIPSVRKTSINKREPRQSGS